MGEIMTNQNDKINVKLDYLPKVNYAMMNNGISTLNSLIIENKDARDWNQLTITVSGNYFRESRALVDMLRAGQAVQVKTVDILPDIQILSETTETVNTVFSPISDASMTSSQESARVPPRALNAALMMPIANTSVCIW